MSPALTKAISAYREARAAEREMRERMTRDLEAGHEATHTEAYADQAGSRGNTWTTKKETSNALSKWS